MSRDQVNAAVYQSRGIVQEYASMSELHPCEVYAFEKFIRDGDSILDIGVGAGRTTPYLSAKAGRYMGLDYSPEMVEAAENRFKNIEFYCGDARNLKNCDSNTFDVVVFSFNGISAIPTIDGIIMCLREAFRVLKSGGTFIFSASNSKFLAFTPSFDGASIKQKTWRAALAFKKTVGLLWRQLQCGVFLKNEGYLFVPVHGGMYVYATTPALMIEKMISIGFQPVELIDYEYPKRRSQIFTGSYCYIAQKAVG